MTTQGIIACAIFIITVILLIWKPIHPILIGTLVPASLVIFKLIDAKTAYSEFANTTIVFFMALLVVGEAFFVTGLADYLGEKIIGLIGKTERGLILGTGIVAGGLSAFLNDTGTTGCLIPIVSSMSEKTKVPKSKLLMALAYFSSLGGTITLIGTTPHILANGILAENGLREIEFFEYTKIGLPLLFIGMIYMYLFGMKLLPNKDIEVSKKSLREKNPKKMLVVSLIFVFVVVSMATKIVPMHIAAVLGAALVVLTNCITIEQAVNSFSVTTLFLVGGIFPLSTALTNSGAAQYFIERVQPLLIGKPGFIVVAGIVLIQLVATQFLLNSSATVLVLPIAILLCKAGGVDPIAGAMAVAVSASGVFVTPFGTGPNLLVWEAGGYEVKDYAKCGLPLLVLFWIFTSILITIFYL